MLLEEFVYVLVKQLPGHITGKLNAIGVRVKDFTVSILLFISEFSLPSFAGSRILFERVTKYFSSKRSLAHCMQWSIDVGNEWIVQNGVSFSGGEEGVVVLCHGNGDDHLNVTLFVPSVPDSRSGLRADTQRLSMHLPAGATLSMAFTAMLRDSKNWSSKIVSVSVGHTLSVFASMCMPRVHSESHVSRNNGLGFLNR